MSYFRRKVADLCDKLSERLRNIESEPIEEEINAEEVADFVDSKKDEYANPSEYNDNNLREIIPVLARADYALELALLSENKDNAQKAIDSLTENLSNIERKRAEFKLIMESIAKSPNADEYRLLKNEKTNDIILFNPNYELNNVMRNQKGFPAVISIDCITNEPKSYFTVEEMVRNNDKYKALIKDDKNPYSIKELKSNFETVGMAVFGIGDIPKAISLVDELFNKEAERVKERIAKNESIIKSTDISERIKTVANYYANENVTFLPALNQAMIFSDNHDSRMILNYDYEMGLINAYYKDNTGKVSQVYDIRDASNGFAYIDNSDYLNILAKNSFNDLIATVGLELNRAKKVEYDYNGVDSYLGNKEFSLDDIGITEVPNKTFCYTTEYSDALALKMEKRVDEYANAVPDDVIVAYNKFNNSINLFCNGGQVSITFDEFGNRMDIFYKREKETVSPQSNPIIFNNRIDSEYARKVLTEDENFKYITQSLAFGGKDIAFGNAGKPIPKGKGSYKADVDIDR